MPDLSSNLDVLIGMCREYGTSRYVRGGCGNASCKDGRTLLVKSSGTTLAGIRADQFVAIRRSGIQKLYGAEAPEDRQAREAMVKDITAAAVLPGARGRPSVEAPLHDILPQTYIIRTHPATINGLACGRDGAAACRSLFPDALWIPYVDPGHAICLEMRRAVDSHIQSVGRPPRVVFLQNHGLFAAADSDQEMRELMDKVMRTVDAEIARAGISLQLPASREPEVEAVGQVFDVLQATVDDGQAACIVHAGPMATSKGPLTPDHIVYAKSFVYDGAPTGEGLLDFRQRNGYWPRVLSTPTGVYGVGPTQKTAGLALEFAADGALVEQFARAFGGVVHLDNRAARFVETWEAENNRRRVATP